MDLVNLSQTQLNSGFVLWGQWYMYICILYVLIKDVLYQTPECDVKIMSVVAWYLAATPFVLKITFVPVFAGQYCLIYTAICQHQTRCFLLQKGGLKIWYTWQDFEFCANKLWPRCERSVRTVWTELGGITSCLSILVCFCTIYWAIQTWLWLMCK